MAEQDLKTILNEKIIGLQKMEVLYSEYVKVCTGLVQQYEKELSQAKKHLNEAKKGSRNCKTDVKKLTNRLHNMTYQSRKYTKEHLGKVLEAIESNAIKREG